VPKLSIITPIYNSADYLEQLLDSVAELRTPHEHLVLDAASSDGTVTLLSERDDPVLDWVSEPDRGQTHAVNKGLAKATGEYVNWVNGDNAYHPEAVDRAVALLDSDPGVDLVFGGIDIIDEQGAQRRRYVPAPYDWRRYLFIGDYIPTETIIFRRSLLDQTGYLDESFQDGADYDFYLRLFHGRQVARLPEPMLLYRFHPASKTASDPWLALREHRTIRAQWARGPLDRAVMTGIYRLKLAVLPHIAPHWPRPYPDEPASSFRAAHASTAAGNGLGPQNQR